MRRIPWWWTLCHLYHRRVKSILEAAAYDPEHMVAPKDLWFDDPGLKLWYDGRRPQKSDAENN